MRSRCHLVFQWKQNSNPQRCICTWALSRREMVNHTPALRVTQRSNQPELMFWHCLRTHSWLPVFYVPQPLRWSSRSLQQHQIQIKYTRWWYSECLASKKKTPKTSEHAKSVLKIILPVTIDIWVKASFWINTAPHFETGIEKCRVKRFTIVRTWSEYECEKVQWDGEWPQIVEHTRQHSETQTMFLLAQYLFQEKNGICWPALLHLASPSFLLEVSLD